jgi:hypothetical protein
VPALETYDHAVVRVVPRVERDEFINGGIILNCDSAGLLSARIEPDERRLLALEPDVDVVAPNAALNGIRSVCAGGPGAGPIGLLTPRERFDWLVADRSTSIRTSPVHSGRCVDPNAAMVPLRSAMGRRPSSAHGSAGRRLKGQSHHDGIGHGTALRSQIHEYSADLHGGLTE